MNFGTRLRALRKGRCMTQQQLAERLGVAKSVVSYYESGDRFPSYDVLIRMSAIFNTSTDYLLGVQMRQSVDVSGLTEEEVDVISSMIELLKKNHTQNE